MPRLKAANMAKTWLASDVQPSDNVLFVQDASSFPDGPFRIIVGEMPVEVMEVSQVDRANNAFLGVIRGLEGTSAKFHPAGSFVENVFTAGVYDELASLNEVNQIVQPIQDQLNSHLNKIATSTQLGHVKVGRNLTIDSDGTLHAQASGGKKVARFVIGTSTAGWTENDVDYLCDGISDHVEINQAIQNLPADGGEIIILSGIYNIGARINVNKNNVTIRGNGDATILKRMWNSSSNEGVITLNSVSNCKIENLKIEGNRSVYTSSNNYGIYLSSSSNNTITGNTCNNNINGIYLSYSNNNTITGNICNNNDIDGIYLYYSNNNTITGNTCNNNSDGIYLYYSNNNTITNNTCNNNSDGIYLASSSENTITGNTFSNNNFVGIDISSGSNNTITGNNCNNNYIAGIGLFSSNNNTVTGNTCNNNNGGGIELSSSSNNTITGNTCNNNIRGIYLSSSNNNTITGNTCIRGTGQSSDYTSSQYTIRLASSNNNYNIISSNNCKGKNVVIDGGTSNTSVNNKYN